MISETTKAEWTPRMLSVLRIAAALTFMAHGTQKLLGFPASDFSPAAFSLMWFAGLLELLGGAALVLGIFTRPVAFVLSGQMAVAYWMAHAPQSFFPVANTMNRKTKQNSMAPSPPLETGMIEPAIATCMNQ